MRVKDAQGKRITVGDRVRLVGREDMATVIAFLPPMYVEVRFDKPRWNGRRHHRMFTGPSKAPFGSRHLGDLVVVGDEQ